MMFQKITQIAVTLTAVICINACANKSIPDDSEQQKHKVIVKTELTSKTALNYQTAIDDIDVSQIPTPKAEDFSIEISQNGNVLQKVPYDQFKDNMELPVGNYLITAYYGQYSASDWNAAYYCGSANLTLSNSQTTANLKLNSTLQTAYAFARFDDKFHNSFKDISVNFITEHTKTPLTFVDGEKRIASFSPADTLYVVVNVTMKSNGKKYTYGIEPLAGLKAGDLHVFNFTVNNGTVMLNVITDNTVAVKEQTMELDPEWIKTRFSKISTSYDPQITIENIYGKPFQTPLDMVVTSNIGLNSLVLKLDDQLTALTGKESINILSPTSEEQNIIDRYIGLTVSKIGLNYRINMKQCVNKLKLRGNSNENYTFTVVATDLLNTCEEKLSVTIIPPTVVRGSQDNGKVWNRYAYIPFARVTNADNSLFRFDYQIREGDNGLWTTVKSMAGASSDLYLNELKPNTKYYSRVCLGDLSWGEQEFTTDIEPQIPNGDFSNYTRTTFSAINTPFWTIDGWETLNLLTTSNKNTSYALLSQAMSCVEIENGAAVITTRGYGSNSKIDHGKKIENVVFQVDTYRNSYTSASAGKIFLGSYDFASKTENHSGMEISRKPKSLRFFYKYMPKEGEWEVKMEVLSNGVVMGTAQMSSSEPEGAGRVVTLPVIYKEDNFNLTPTHVKLYFTSQKTSSETGSAVAANDTNLSIYYGNDKRGSYKALGGGTQWVSMKDSYYFGSKLTIDNVELIYPQDINDSYSIQ